MDPLPGGPRVAATRDPKRRRRTTYKTERQPDVSRILILSSQVAAGHVGLSAAAPVLQALGHEVTGLPTTVLSNHPGFGATAGQPVPPAQLARMVDALDANGWLLNHDALLVGYLPTPYHVDLAARLIDRLREGAPALHIVVDPILGDWPGGLYLPRAVAEEVRGTLLPRADTITPNCFELAWLAGREIASLPEALEAARALGRLGPRTVHVTSPPLGPERTGVLSVTAGTQRLHSAPRLAGMLHGTGDVFAALTAGGLPAGQALGHLQALIAASIGAPHLRIAQSASDWTRAAPLPPEPAAG